MNNDAVIEARPVQGRAFFLFMPLLPSLYRLQADKYPSVISWKFTRPNGVDKRMSNLTIQPVSLDAPRLTASPVTNRKTSRTQQPIQQIDSQVLQSALTVNEQDDEANLEVANSGKAKSGAISAGRK